MARHVLKRIYLIFFLLLISILVTAQGKKSAIKASRNTYTKTDLSHNRSMYLNDKSLVNLPEVQSEIDRNAVVEIPESKTVYGIFKGIFADEQMRLAPLKERITIVLLFDKKGKPLTVSFIIPDSINIRADQLQRLESEIRDRFEVKITFSRDDQLYQNYGLPVPFSKILDGTYPY